MIRDLHMEPGQLLGEKFIEVQELQLGKILCGVRQCLTAAEEHHEDADRNNARVLKPDFHDLPQNTVTPVTPLLHPAPAVEFLHELPSFLMVGYLTRLVGRRSQTTGTGKRMSCARQGKGCRGHGCRSWHRTGPLHGAGTPRRAGCSGWIAPRGALQSA